MTDNEFLLHVLSDGQPWTLQQILARSFAERGHGLTVHSRAAEIRAAGHDVRVTAGRRGGVYRLVAGSGERDETILSGDAPSRSPDPEQLALSVPRPRELWG